MTTLGRYGHPREEPDGVAADGPDEAYSQSGMGFPWGANQNDVVGSAAK